MEMGLTVPDFFRRRQKPLISIARKEYG